jgi:FkbH-like protein
MDSWSFLSPDSLQVQRRPIRRLLLIGSCFAELYAQRLLRCQEGLECDVLLINNESPLPDSPPKPLEEYDAQCIVLPLRTILTDAVLVTTNFLQENFFETILTEGKARMERVLANALKYAKSNRIHSFVSNFVIPQGHSLISLHQGNELAQLVGILNFHLQDLTRNYPNTFLLDAESIASSIGKRYFLGDFIEFSTHNTPFFPDWADHEMAPYWTHPQKGRIDDLPSLGTVYENRIDEFFRCFHAVLRGHLRTLSQENQVKLVIFDLDNTLWRGLLSEHYGKETRPPYADGWPIGVWEAVQVLRARGILVAIVSKNDHETVTALWHSAVPIPILHLKDFSAVKINWRPKPENIAEILAELRLTEESALFIDDNPLEREAVHQAFPAMRVTGSNPFLTRRTLMWAPELLIPRVTATSQTRFASLKARKDHSQEEKSVSRKEFLASLNIAVSVTPLTGPSDPHFSRCLELLNKTNQFNTTGKRWTLPELDEHLSSGKIFYFSASDRFAEHGIVGVVLVSHNQIVQFVMSCRVIGLDIEFVVLRNILQAIRRESDLPILALLQFTDRNTPCRSFYPTAGFSPKDGSEFLLELPAHKPIALPGEPCPTSPQGAWPKKIVSEARKILCSLQRRFRT